MANPTMLQDQWNAGVKDDLARARLPRNALWNATDMLPNIEGADFGERGGWANASDSITATVATASQVIAGIYAPYSAGNTQIAIDEDGNLVKITSDATVTNVGAAVAPAQNPIFYRDTVIIPGSTVKKVTNAAGTLTIANLGGTPPTGSYAGVFSERVVIAKDEILYFSDPGNEETWDQTNSTWAFSLDITAFVPQRASIMVFHESQASLLRGTVPPPNGDFAVDEPWLTVGCSDARSLGYWKDQVIFASAGGLHITDGAGYDNLTALCGRQRFWLDALDGYDRASWTITGGVIRDHYFFSVMNGATFVTAGVINLRTFAWWPLTNLKARSMWVAQTSTDELYFGRRDAARLGKLSGIFVPAAANKNDGDGTAVAGSYETGYFRGKTGAKSWKKLYSTDKLADYASDNPTVAASYITTSDATSYTSLGTFSENTTEDRRRIPMGFKADGVAFKFVRANAGDWRVSSIEAEVTPQERSR